MSKSISSSTAKNFASLVGLTVALVLSTALADRPNIVLILADDLGL